MSLEYIISPDQWFSATIVQYPNSEYVQDFIRFIGSNDQASVLCSNFYRFLYGFIYRREEKEKEKEEQLSSKLVHEFIMRLINCGKENEIWVRLDDHVARFGMQEFCLITGLPCHEPSMDIDHNNDRLRNHYFNGTKKISMTMLSQTFRMCEDEEDKFKLGLVMLVECVLKPTSRQIDYRILDMVDHLDEFLVYPWGRKAYFTLLNSLKESQSERILRMQRIQQRESKYALQGYPLAFQYWIYETFPEIGKKFGRRTYKSLQSPRMHRWKPKKIINEKTIKQFLDTKEITVLAVLQPTEEELEAPWYRTLSLPADNEHGILDAIVNGEIDNIAPEIPDNIYGQERTIPGASRTSTEIGSSSVFGGSNYVTEDRMEEMMRVQRQTIISYISGLYDNMKAEIIADSRANYHAILENQKQLFEEQRKWHEDYIQSGIHQEARYQAIVERQEQSFERQQKWQEDYYRGMKSYVDTSISSVRSHIDERHDDMVNRMSNWESNMETIIGSMQHHLSVHASPIPSDRPQETPIVEPVESVGRLEKEKEKKGKSKQSSSSKVFHL